MYDEPKFHVDAEMAEINAALDKSKGRDLPVTPETNYAEDKVPKRRGRIKNEGLTPSDIVNRRETNRAAQKERKRQERDAALAKMPPKQMSNAIRSEAAAEKERIRQIEEKARAKEEIQSIELLASAPKWQKKAGRRYKDERLSHVDMIRHHWPEILKAARNGYTFEEISASINIDRTAFHRYLRNYPDKKVELIRSKYQLRDEMLGVVVKAARGGNWLPAMTLLERLFPQSFARPEIKLQMYDRMINSAETIEQRIGGKTMSEIKDEIEIQFKDKIDERRISGNAGSGSIEHRSIESNAYVNGSGSTEEEDS